MPSRKCISVGCSHSITDGTDLHTLCLKHRLCDHQNPCEFCPAETASEAASAYTHVSRPRTREPKEATRKSSRVKSSKDRRSEHSTGKPYRDGRHAPASEGALDSAGRSGGANSRSGPSPEGPTKPCHDDRHKSKTRESRRGSRDVRDVRPQEDRRAQLLRSLETTTSVVDGTLLFSTSVDADNVTRGVTTPQGDLRLPSTGHTSLSGQLVSLYGGELSQPDGDCVTNRQAANALEKTDQFKVDASSRQPLLGTGSESELVLHPAMPPRQLLLTIRS